MTFLATFPDLATSDFAALQERGMTINFGRFTWERVSAFGDLVIATYNRAGVDSKNLVLIGESLEAARAVMSYETVRAGEELSARVGEHGANALFYADLDIMFPGDTGDKTVT